MNQRMAIGKRIRVLLAQQNRSLKELAAAAGLSEQYVNDRQWSHDAHARVRIQGCPFSQRYH